MYKCSFCKKDFHDKTTLNRHKKSAKFCIDIQRENGITTNADVFNCVDCGKVFTLKRVLTKHISTCKKIKCIDQEKEKEYKQESTILSNSVLLEDYLNAEYIKNIFRGCTLEEYLAFTPASVIDRIIPLLNGEKQSIYYCSDRSRQRFFYVENSENIEDIQAIKLRTLIYNGMYCVFSIIHSNRLIYIESQICKCKRMKEDGDSLLKSWRTDRDILLEQFEKLNILKNSKDYLTALSKKLPVKTGVQKIKSIDPIVFDISRVKMLTYEIGGYNISELMYYREKYIKYKVETHPRDFDIKDNKEYTFFLNATDEELLERYGR